jgi:hypothetical protein
VTVVLGLDQRDLVRSAAHGQSAELDPVMPLTSQLLRGGVSLSRTTTIFDNDPAGNMKRIAVTVNWTENNGVARAVTLQTILAQ